MIEDQEKSREQLLAELKSLKKRLSGLETSKEVLDMLINNIPNQVFWKDRNLIYVGCNQAFAEVTGMGTPAEVIGKTDYDFHRDATHADSYREWDKKIMDSGEPTLNIEEKYHNSDGSEGTILTSKVPLRGSDGEVFGLLGICTDITERKNIELENESLIIELKEAIGKVKTLGGLLPICSNCKKVRDDKGYWKQIELFIKDNSEAEFSHSICPDCAKKLYPDLIDKVK